MAKNRYNRGKVENFHSFLLFLGLIAAFFVLFSFVIGFARVEGHSMDGEFEDGEIVLMTRLRKDVSRGEVIDILLPTGEYYIKRVAAVAGDTVDIVNGMFYVNGEPERAGTYPEDGPVIYPYTVPEGCVFILGDCREQSVDSRAFGAVNLAGLKGVIKYRLGWLYISAV